MVIKSHQDTAKHRKMLTLSVVKPIGSQRGAIVLSLSVIFLLLTTFVTLYTTNAILLEQKITNAQTRSKFAFEAAEFGLSTAIQYISDGVDRDEDGNVDAIFDVDANNVGTTNTSAVGEQSVTVTITEVGPNALTAFRIVSQGFSDDSSATRTISKISKLIDTLPNVPDNPMTTRGTVAINGSATVHNPEGNSTIWSGGDVDIGANNATATYVADPSGAGYPSCMDTPMTCSTAKTSNKVTVGLDIIEHDSNLNNLDPEEMFENFFGMSPEAYREAIVTIDLAAGSDFSAGAALAQDEVIWYDGDVAINGVTVGCSTAVNGNNFCPQANEDPSIVIINGNATMSGGPHFYGIVFVLGDISLSGNSTFNGALVVAGDTNNSSGSLDVYYNSRLLENVRDNAGFSSSSGTWKDF